MNYFKTGSFKQGSGVGRHGSFGSSELVAT